MHLSLGGAFNAIYYHTNLGYYLNKIIRGDYNKPSKVKDILFIGVLAFIIAAVLLYIIVKMRKKSTEIFDMDVEMDQKTITVKGFKDTGNRLTEPMSKKCVSLIELELFQAASDRRYGKIYPGIFKYGDDQL